MTSQFKTLLTIAMNHPYYEQGGDDFEFLLPSDTVQTLRNTKIMARSREGRRYFLYEADGAGNAIIDGSGKTLRIGLKLKNTFFSNFTTLPFGDSEAIPLFSNTSSSGLLDAAEETILVGKRFRHTLKKPDRPVTVHLKNSDDTSLKTETITLADNRLDIAFDLSGFTSGSYKLEAIYPGETLNTAYYLEPELRQAGLFGMIEIQLDAGFYNTAPEFQIPFQAREEILKYYLVVKNYSEAEFAQLSVSDAGFSEEKRPQINFTKVSSEAFTVDDLSPALLGDSTARKVLFKSQTALARREKARKRIQLRKNGDVLIAHLPQPGAHQSSSDQFIQISKP